MIEDRNNTDRVYEINSLTALVKLHEFIHENPVDVSLDELKTTMDLSADLDPVMGTTINDDPEFDYDLLHDCEHGYDKIYNEYCDQLCEDPYKGRKYNVEDD